MSKLWNKEELDYLKEKYDKIRTKEIAEKLGRSSGAIRSKAKKLGLRKKCLKDTDWTKEDDDFLREHCYTSTNKELALALDRTEQAVSHRRSLLKITKYSDVKEGYKRCGRCKKIYPKTKEYFGYRYTYCKDCTEKIKIEKKIREIRNKKGEK